MGRKRGRKQEGEGAGSKKLKINPQNNPEPACRLLAVHGDLPFLVISVGRHVRSLNWSSAKVNTVTTDDPAISDTDTSIRATALHHDGKYLLTGGDDKLVRLWDTSSWTVLRTIKAHKKISAGLFSNDGHYLLYADKFGDVLCARIDGQEPPQTVLGHFCSIITSLAQSPDSRYLVSTDREFKVRVNNVPQDLLQGSQEIQTYCLGHSAFVTSALFVGEHEAVLLLTAGGDGTVRLWNHETGRLLDTLQAVELPAGAAEKATPAGGEPEAEGEGAEEAGGQREGEEQDGDEGQPQEEEEGEEEQQGGGEAEEATGRRTDPVMAGIAVLSLAATRDGSTVAAALEGSHEVLLVRVDAAAQKLHAQQRLRFDRVAYPCRAAFDCQGRLWALGGVPALQTKSAHVGVAKLADGGEWVECTDEVLTQELREALECRDDDEEESLAAAPTLSYSEHLRKVRLTIEECEGRKKNRNDKKEAARLAALLGGAPA